MEPLQLLLAACKNNEAIVVEELLAKGIDVSAEDEDGVTPLQTCCAHGNKSVVELLVCRGANVNHTNHSGWSPLMHALFHGQLDVAHFLLQRNADVYARSKLGTTPLVAACCGGHLSCVTLLLEYESIGSLQRFQQDGDPSPAMAAALHGHDHVLRLLMSYDDIFNKADSVTKLTALMFAAASGQLSTVQMLVEHGADPNLTSVINHTALDIASACGRWEVKAYLGEKTIMQHVSSVGSKEKEEPVMLAVKQGNMKDLERLLDQSLDSCNGCSHVSGLSPLMQAALLGNVEAAYLLLRKGASIDAQDKNNKWTALMFAVFHRKTNVVALLLDEGANVELRGAHDCSALDLVWVCNGGQKELIDLFMKRKSSPKHLLTVPKLSPTTSTLRSDSKRTRRSSRNNSFRAWMSSRFSHLKRSRSSVSLPEASPSQNSDGLSDGDDEGSVFPIKDGSSPQPTSNTRSLKLSSLHFLRKDWDSQGDWNHSKQVSNKQVHPPLLPSSSNSHSPLPQEYLPPLRPSHCGHQSKESGKEFYPSFLLRRYHTLQSALCKGMASMDLETASPPLPFNKSTEKLSVGDWEKKDMSWRTSFAEGQTEQITKRFGNGKSPMDNATEDVELLLHNLSLERYVPRFQAHEIDIEALKGVTEEDLHEIGIHSIGSRQQLLAAISQLQ